MPRMIEGLPRPQAYFLLEAAMRWRGCAATGAWFQMTEGDATFVQVVRRQFKGDFVSGQDTNAVLAHFSACVGDKAVAVFQCDAKA